MIGMAFEARERAPAKLNLYLDVLGRRDDGFHELETLFVSIDWADDLSLHLRTDHAPAELEIEGDDTLPADEDNLVLKAWRAATADMVAAPAARFHLHKRIPIGAGLGGGSSNAAAALRLVRRWRGTLPRSAHALATALGSDVPFLLAGGAAIGRGRGEELAPLPVPPALEVVLCLQPYGCSTRQVFAEVKRGMRRPPEGTLPRLVDALERGDAKTLRDVHHNSLALPAMHAEPRLLRAASAIERRLGRAPCLSGSGSTLYDVPDPGTASAVVDALDGLPGTRRIVRLGTAPGGADSRS